MTESRIASMIIGIGSSPDQRRQLAQLLSGAEAFLIVSRAEQAQEFLDASGPPQVTVLAPPAHTVITGSVPDAAPTSSDLTVDSDRRVLRWLDREVALTRLEHDFLHCLLGTPGQVWTYERLHLAVWGNKHLGRGSDMHSVVRRVRHKLTRLNATATIHTVRGVGFRLSWA